MTSDTLSDLQIQKLVTDVFAGRIPFNEQVGFEIDIVDVSDLKLHFDMKDALVGNFMHGILHGGVTTAALDVIGGVAVFVEAAKTMPATKTSDDMREWFSRLATIDMRVDFLQPGAGVRFTATADVMRIGRRIAAVRSDLFNERSERIAAATATYTRP